MRKVWIGLAIAVLAVGVAVQGTKAYSYFKTEKAAQAVDIDKDGASSLAVDVTFGAGSLLIERGSPGWVDGRFDTTVKKWRPSVRYTEKRGVGHVDIHQKMKGLKTLGNQRNDWQLRLTDEIPVDLRVDLGVADADLDLSGIRLSHLSVDAGVGSSTVNLAGDWQDGFDVKLDSGIGEMKVLLPKDTGIRLNVEKGIGRVDVPGLISKGKGIYVNDAYEGASTVIDVKADVGIGTMTFEIAE